MRCMFRRLYGNKSSRKSSSSATGRVEGAVEGTWLQNIITFWDDLKEVLSAECL